MSERSSKDYRLKWWRQRWQRSFAARLDTLPERMMSAIAERAAGQPDSARLDQRGIYPGDRSFEYIPSALDEQL